MRGNLPVPSHRRALRARLLSFPLLGFTESLSMHHMAYEQQAMETAWRSQAYKQRWID